MSLTPEQRALRARLAAHARWAKTADRAKALVPAQSAFRGRFEKEVDPEGKLPVADRLKLAESARKAYYTRLAYKSARVRASRSGGLDDAA
jgi:hypothetical protein